ncbi:MAG TPA: RNA polymerase sigma factor, partial [Candidatus Angelobacter sp.]|nr:RNA polymerase sigma factor [Candidatus Angelobacter sp.]
MSPKLKQALELIREDRPEAVNEALALLQNTVYSFSMRVCGHPEDAEDTMQDVLLRLLPYLAKFESPQALSVWLYKVARNRCITKHRGAKNASNNRVSLDELMPTPENLEFLMNVREPDPETSLLRSERDARVRQALQKVPPMYRMTLVLHDMEDLSTAEVAEVTGMREGTVRVRLHRGRLILRQHMERLARANSLKATKLQSVVAEAKPTR